MLADSLKKFIKTTSTAAGVYHFIDKNQQTLYIGKAKNLRNRLNSYCNDEGLTSRIAKMTSLAQKIDIIICDNEEKALILECNLIKQKQPKFNVLLRDDKSFPFILVNKSNDFAKVEKHRGPQKSKGHYFGPFATSYYLSSAIDLIRKTFLLRDCKNSEFDRRKTPCLEYQIKRCSAPCVGKISKQDYQKNVKNALDFLKGKHGFLQQELAVQMQKYGEEMEYEKALILRERIKALSAIQAKFIISCKWAQDSDIIFVKNIGDLFCVAFSFYRLGYDYGTKFYFFNDIEELNLDELILQFYFTQELPKQIFLNYRLDDMTLLQNVLFSKTAKKVKFEFFNSNHEAKSILSKNIIEQKQRQILIELEKKYKACHKNIKILSKLAEIFDLQQQPKRIEIYDNSHIAGQHKIGAMVVFEDGGLNKNAYRKFNIRQDELDHQDDCAMMQQVMRRRFREYGKDNFTKPDLIIIDGGKGQLSAVIEVFSEIGVNDVKLVSMAKGKNRNAGNESFFQLRKKELKIMDKEILFFLQNLRDEVHNFVIRSHRKLRSKNTFKSKLDEISGIGKYKRNLLLNHFGSVQAVMNANIDQLMVVKGVSQKLAKEILSNS